MQFCFKPVDFLFHHRQTSFHPSKALKNDSSVEFIMQRFRQVK